MFGIKKWSGPWTICFNDHLGWQVHRLVIVDKDNRCIGVLSLSDILKFLVLRPLGKCPFVCFFVCYVIVFQCCQGNRLSRMAYQRIGQVFKFEVHNPSKLSSFLTVLVYFWFVVTSLEFPYLRRPFFYVPSL